MRRLGVMLLLAAAGLAASVTGASADQITVTLNAGQSRNMTVPLVAPRQPARQRQVRRGYVRLLGRATAVCRKAKRKGRKAGQPAVTADRALLSRFNRARKRLDRVLRRARLPRAPGIRDFSQLRRLWSLKRPRRSSAGRRVRARPIRARIDCRFD